MILETGDILELSPSKRMIYRGEDTAQMQLWYPVSGEWKSEDGCKVMPLNAQQKAFWLSKK